MQKELQTDKESTLRQVETTAADEHRYHQQETNALQGHIQVIETTATFDLATSHSEKDALLKECEERDDQLKTLKDMLCDDNQVSFVSTKPMSE